MKYIGERHVGQNHVMLEICIIYFCYSILTAVMIALDEISLVQYRFNTHIT